MSLAVGQRLPCVLWLRIVTGQTSSAHYDDNMLCSEGREASKAGAALAEEAEVETLYYVQGGAAAWKVRS